MLLHNGVIVVSRTKINWGKVLNALFDERSCLNFFFLRFYGPGMLSLDFCLEGKGVSKTGRGSEVKNKAIFGFKNYHSLKSL